MFLVLSAYDPVFKFVYPPEDLPPNAQNTGILASLYCQGYRVNDELMIDMGFDTDKVYGLTTGRYAVCCSRREPEKPFAVLLPVCVQ